jgi:hypothetical protein
VSTRNRRASERALPYRGHHGLQLADGVWGANAGNDILSLSIDKVLAIKLVLASRRIAAVAKEQSTTYRDVITGISKEVLPE